MPGTKALVYTRAGVLGDGNNWYYTGTDADIDTQIANVKSTNGSLVDGTLVNYAEVISPIYLDGSGNPYGGVPTGIKFDQRVNSTDFVNQRIWDPGQCAMNVLRLASAGKNLETITTGTDIFEINTQTGRDVSPHIPIDCIATSVQAQGTLTSADTGAFTAGKIVTIGTKVYTFRATITGASVDGDVLAGANGDAGLTNLMNAINLGTGAGTTYAAAMTAGPASSGAVTAHALVITALAGGTAGNSLTFSTDEAKLSVDAATLGTTTAGVDPTATNVATAFVLAMNTSGTLGLVAEKISANEVVVALQPPSVSTMATTETLAGSNNAWDQTTLRGGKAAGLRRRSKQKRVPTTQEVTLTHMHFEFDFAPSLAEIRVVVTATPGLNVAFDGSVEISGDRVTIIDGGSTHLATTQTVFVEVTD